LGKFDSLINHQVYLNIEKKQGFMEKKFRKKIITHMNFVKAVPEDPVANSF